MLAPVKPQLSHHRTTSSSWLQPPPISYSFSIIPPKYPIKPQIGAPPPTSNSSTIPTKNTAKHRIPDLYAYNPNFNPNHKYKTPKPQSSCHIPITDCKDHRSAPHRNTYPSTNPKSRFLLSTSRRHNHRWNRRAFRSTNQSYFTHNPRPRNSHQPLWHKTPIKSADLHSTIDHRFCQNPPNAGNPPQIWPLPSPRPYLPSHLSQRPKPYPHRSFCAF